MAPADTQRIYPEEPLPVRCLAHVRRLDKLESRMESVEKRISGIEDLRTDVRLMSDRVRLILWLTGIATGAIIVGVIGMALNAVVG